jgi:hypothetical protein
MGRAAKCRISKVNDDWVEKGCHVHVGNVEVALRPDHLGGVVCRKVYSRIADWELDAATKVVLEQLRKSRWRRQLRRTVKKGMVHLLGVEGEDRAAARGRLRELRMLLVALERMEQP